MTRPRFQIRGARRRAPLIRLVSGLALACGGLPLMAQAAPPVAKPLVFTSGDWVLVCDNTRHCTAAGYRADDDADRGIRGRELQQRFVTLQITRDGGPDAQPIITMGTEFEGVSDQPAILTLEGGGRLETKDYRPIPIGAFRHLLPRLQEADAAKVSQGSRSEMLSLAGMKAVLLKFDEFQGRVGTQGALLARGRKPDAAVPPAVAPPVITRLPLVKERPGDAALLAKLVTKLRSSEDECDIEGDAAVSDSTIQRVSEHELIVLRACSRGQHAADMTVWLVDDRPPHAVRKLLLPQYEEPPVDIANSLSFDGQVLNRPERRLPEQDCGSQTQWVWNGRDFTLAMIARTPLCIHMAGGVDFPFYTTKY